MHLFRELRPEETRGDVVGARAGRERHDDADRTVGIRIGFRGCGALRGCGEACDGRGSRVTPKVCKNSHDRDSNAVQCGPNPEMIMATPTWKLSGQYYETC